MHNDLKNQVKNGFILLVLVHICSMILSFKDLIFRPEMRDYVTWENVLRGS